MTPLGPRARAPRVHGRQVSEDNDDAITPTPSPAQPLPRPCADTPPSPSPSPLPPPRQKHPRPTATTEIRNLNLPDRPTPTSPSGLNLVHPTDRTDRTDRLTHPARPRPVPTARTAPHRTAEHSAGNPGAVRAGGGGGSCRFGKAIRVWCMAAHGRWEGVVWCGAVHGIGTVSVLVLVPV